MTPRLWVGGGGDGGADADDPGQGMDPDDPLVAAVSWWVTRGARHARRRVGELPDLDRAARRGASDTSVRA